MVWCSVKAQGQICLLPLRVLEVLAVGMVDFRVPKDYPLTNTYATGTDIVLGYGLDDRGFESRQGLEIFLFITASRPTLGPTQPPIQ
jgi:hypothetical protein